MSNEALIKYFTFISCVVGPFSLLGSTIILTTIGREQYLSGSSNNNNNSISSRRRRIRRSSSSDNNNNFSRSNSNSNGNILPHRRRSSGSINYNNNGSCCCYCWSSLSTYQRLMICICIFDLLFSFALTLGPLPVPEEFNPWGKGNVATCTLQGVVTYIGFATFAYNAMLMILFVLVIKYDISNRILTKYVEPIMHILVIGYYGITAILGLVWQIFNFSGSTCFVSAVPKECEEIPDVVGECVRGGDYIHIFGSWILVFVYSIWTIIIVLCSLIVAFTVLYRYYQSRRYVFRGSGGGGGGGGGNNNNNNNNNNGSNGNANGGEQRQQQHRRQQQPSQMGARTVREVIVQCALYAGTFLNNMIWLTIRVAIYKLAANPLEYSNTMIVLVGIGKFFFPLQGFFNMLIYLRPRYSSIRTKHKNQGRCFAVKEAIWFPVSTPDERESRGGGEGEPGDSRKGGGEEIIVTPNGTSRVVPGVGESTSTPPS